MLHHFFIITQLGDNTGIRIPTSWFLNKCFFLLVGKNRKKISFCSLVTFKSTNKTSFGTSGLPFSPLAANFCFQVDQPINQTLGPKKDCFVSSSFHSGQQLIYGTGSLNQQISCLPAPSFSPLTVHPDPQDSHVHLSENTST